MVTVHNRSSSQGFITHLLNNKKKLFAAFVDLSQDFNYLS